MGAGERGAAERWALVRAFGRGSTEVVGDSGKGDVMRERGRSQRGLTYGRMRHNTEGINYSEEYGKRESCWKAPGAGAGLLRADWGVAQSQGEAAGGFAGAAACTPPLARPIPMEVWVEPLEHPSLHPSDRTARALSRHLALLSFVFLLASWIRSA